MKKLMLGCDALRSICAVGMIAFAATAEAAAVQVTIDNLVYEVDNQGKTAKLIGDDGHNHPTEINVAEVLWFSRMLPVTEVVDSAFRQSIYLTSVSLPNATTIGTDAFRGCKRLTSVSLPKATTIGNSVFKDSPSIETVVLSWGLLANPNRVGWGLGDGAILVGPDTKEEIENAGSKVERVIWLVGDRPVENQDYETACAYYGITPKSVQTIGGDDIVVKKESIQAAKAETISIANNEIQLGVSVMSNANITAEIAEWGKVKFDENTKVGLSEDGTQLIISIPVAAQQGFMILQSGDAKAVPSNGAKQGFYKLEAR